MTKPQRFPVEEARKKLADLLDGSQFRNEHAEITRRAKPAGYLVPPDWYVSANEALAEVKALRKEAASLRAAASGATVKPPGSQPASAPKPPERTIDLTDSQLASLANLARSRSNPERLARLEGIADRALPGRADLAVVEEAYRRNLIRDEDIQH